MSFFKRLRNAFKKKTGTSTRFKGSKIRVDRPKGGRGSYKTMRMKKNSDFDNLKMDLGIKKRNKVYYRDLAERSEKSKQALADMQARRRRDRRRARKNDDTTTTSETEEVTNVTENTGNNTTTLDANTDAALTNVENISDRTFNNTDDITNYFDNTATSVNTAAGQEQNQASALTTSVGEAEDDAISYMTSGTGSNILTSAQGLLGGDDEDENDPFNRRKTLIGA